MAECLDDGEFWLPPQFLTDDDLFFDKKRSNPTTLTPFKSSPIDDFSSEASRFTEGNFPSEFPYGYDISSGGVSSVISSLVDSAEHCDDEDLISYKMAGCFNVESGLKGNVVGENTMGWAVSGSPQSTLCGIESCCRCMKLCCHGSQFQCSTVSSPPTTWDLLHAAAGEVARMRMDNEGFTHNSNSRGILGPPKGSSPVPLNLRNSNADSGHLQKQLIAFQKLQAAQFQQLRQQQLRKQQYTEAWKALAKGSTAPYSQQYQAQPVVQERVGSGGGSVDLSHNAWPCTQQVQHRQGNPGMRAVFLANRSAKKECAGTGVFLPRQTSNSAAKDSRKKSGKACATVLLPAKVVQALKLDEGGQKPQFHRRLNGTFHPNGENTARPRNCNAQKRSLKPQADFNSTEVRLPQDWTY